MRSVSAAHLKELAERLPPLIAVRYFEACPDLKLDSRVAIVRAAGLAAASCARRWIW